MIDTKKIEQLARQVHESMPKGIRELGDDVEKKIRQTLQAQLTRLDVVNREEFDVQTQVLLRTREKLAALEQRLAVLEGRDKGTSAPAAPAQPAAAAPVPVAAPASSTAATQPGSASAPAAAPAAPVKAADPDEPV